jgi:hypothetical protein
MTDEAFETSIVLAALGLTVAAQVLSIKYALRYSLRHGDRRARGVVVLLTLVAAIAGFFSLPAIEAVMRPSFVPSGEKLFVGEDSVGTMLMFHAGLIASTVLTNVIGARVLSAED